MKSCAYCGRENGVEAVHCLECGTAFTVPEAAEPPAPTRHLGGLKFIAMLIIGLFVVAFLYFLSFGPVSRWTVTKGTTVPPTMLTNASTEDTTTTYYATYAYPGWVGIVYHPALKLRHGNPGGLSEAYARYITWWER